MKKFIIITFVVLTGLVFNGCAKLNVNCGIDNDYNAFVEYDFAIDTNNVPPEVKTSTKDFMSEIAQNYEKNLGYELTSDIRTDKDIISFSLEKNVKCNSYEEAFETLKELLTNEKETPFLNVNMDMDSTDFEKSFIFYADTDFDKIIKTSGYEKFPEDINEIIEDGLEDFSGSVCVSLPAHEYTCESEHVKYENNIATYLMPISLTTSTVLDISTRINLENDKLSTLTISQAIENSQNKINFYIVLISLCTVVFMALVVVVVLVIVKKNKTHEEPQNTENVSNEKETKTEQ